MYCDQIRVFIPVEANHLLLDIKITDIEYDWQAIGKIYNIFVRIIEGIPNLLLVELLLILVGACFLKLATQKRQRENLRRRLIMISRHREVQGLNTPIFSHRQTPNR